MRLADLVAPVLLLAAAPAMASPWAGTAGNGQPTTETRAVPSFDRIRLEGSTDVTVSVGEGPSVTVTIDSNLQPLLETVVKGNTLVIRAEGRIRPKKDPKVAVTVPELRGVEISGSGDVTIEGGKGELALSIEGSGDLRWRGEATELRAEIEGSGDIRLEGRADRLRAQVEGSGDVDASRLVATDAEAKVRGSGDVELNLAGGKLDATVEGSGDIRWRGTANVERARVAGSGEISRRD